MSSLRSSLRRVVCAAFVAALASTPVLVAAGAAPARAASYAPIVGTGSSWAFNAISNWTSNGKKFGWQVNYTPSGSSQGRKDYLNNQNDFASSDIPFVPNPTDNSSPERPAVGTYAYMPVVAGGTAFMYNLKIGGRQVTNLRLSGENIARIFTGKVSKWNDAAIAKDNPGLTLPATKVVPVIRADGSGSSAQFSLWMDSQFRSIWTSAYPQGGETSFWPQVPGSQAKSGDDGVANYVRQPYGDGAVGYVQYSYAKNAGFPVAKMLNKSGYYVEPTPQNVSVALLKAKINDSNPNDLATYLTQDLTQVYVDGDSRTYPLSSYSYMILPLTKCRGLAATATCTNSRYSDSKAQTLGAFGKYLLCDGQDAMSKLGYAPLPYGLVQGAFKQLARAPGVTGTNFDIKKCKNPTFSADGSNTLANTAPKPPACDKQGPTQCSTGTGGAQASTQVKPAARGTTTTTGTTTTGGGTGNTSATSGTSGGTAADPGTVDPDSGLAVDGSANGAEVPLAGPVSLNSSGGGGWGNSQTLAILAGLLLLAVFVVPPVLVSRLGRRDDTGRS